MSQHEPVPQRIGDAERDRAIEWLREHRVQGRLDETEFDERLTAAMSAKTSSDLDPLFSDLPDPRPGLALATTPGFTAPLNATPAGLDLTPPTTQAASSGKKWNTALVVASSIAWPLTLLLLFATSWSYWWLIFIPIAISSIAGKNHQDSGQTPRRDDRPGIGS